MRRMLSLFATLALAGTIAACSSSDATLKGGDEKCCSSAGKSCCSTGAEKKECCKAGQACAHCGKAGSAEHQH